MEIKEGDCMISPSLYLIFVYMLAAPMIAALSVYRHRQSKMSLILAVVLMAVMVYCAFLGFPAFTMAFLFSTPIFALCVFCSAGSAVVCVREREAGTLRFGSVAMALGFYFVFLCVVILITPVVRWCEGCKCASCCRCVSYKR